MVSIRDRLIAALAAEYAKGWPFYNEDTRRRMGDEQARINIDTMMRAVNRAGFSLAEITDCGSSKPLPMADGDK